MRRKQTARISIKEVPKAFDYEGFIKKNCSPSVKTAFEIAEKKAYTAKSDYIETAHILWALLHGEEGAPTRRLLRDLKVNTDDVNHELLKIVREHPSPHGSHERLYYTPRVRQILEKAYRLAHHNARLPVSNEYVLLAIVQTGETQPYEVLANFGVQREALERKIQKMHK